MRTKQGQPDYYPGVRWGINNRLMKLKVKQDRAKKVARRSRSLQRLKRRLKLGKKPQPTQ